MRTPSDQLMLVIAADGALSEPADFTRWAPDRPAYQCRGCGWILPDLCFRPYRPASRSNRASTVASRAVHSRCVSCEQDAKDEWKRTHRFEHWSARALSRHLRIERKAGLHDCTTRAEYEDLTGITVAWLAAEAKRTYERPDADCPHCAVRWTDMPNGHRDLTLDRVDRRRILSRSNYQFMCPTGNSQKGVLDPRTYDMRQTLFREKRRRAH